MALKHAQPDDVIDLRHGVEPAEAAVSTSLLRTRNLQLLRLVLAAGQEMPEHRVAGEATIQCLQGEVDVRTPTRVCRLTPGTLVMLQGGEPHSVQAHAEAVLLVTLLHTES